MIKNTFDIVRTLLPPNSSSVAFSGWQHQLPSYSEPKDRHPLSYSDLDTQFTMGYIQIIAHSYPLISVSLAASMGCHYPFLPAQSQKHNSIPNCLFLQSIFKVKPE